VFLFLICSITYTRLLVTLTEQAWLLPSAVSSDSKIKFALP
jgi:hypothetical protein